MVFFGVFGILQVALLPGLLIYKLSKTSFSFIRGLLTIFGLSLLSNYILVFILTVAKLYSRPVLIILILAEVFSIFYLYRKLLLTSFEISYHKISGRINQYISTVKPGSENLNGANIITAFIRGIFAITAIFSLVWIFRVFITNIGSVFNSWDAIVSWNRWAVDWAGNHLPLSTWNYPQLNPINWSITYVLTGNTEVQLFAKSIIPIFTMAILFIFVDLFIKRKNYGYLLGLAISAYILRALLGEYIIEGYSDIPAAFFGFMAFTSLLRIDPQKDDVQKAYVIGGIFAGAAAVTKQTGLLIMILYALFAFIGYYLPDRQLSFRQKLRKWIIPLIYISLFVLPWYVYKQIDILRGVDKSEIALIGDITNTAYDRANLVIQSFQSLTSLGNILILFGLCIPSIAIIERKLIYLVAIVILPYTLIWSVYSSYDHRNLAMMYPLVALVCGVATDRVLELLKPVFMRIKLMKIPIISILLLFVVGTGFYLSQVSDQKLIDRQEALQRQIFNARLNEKIYDIIQQNGNDTLILTDYPIRYLPRLAENQVKLRFNDLVSFQNSIQDPQLDFILLPKSAIKEIDDYIDLAVLNGDMEFLFTDNRWKPYSMYRVIRNPEK